MKPAFYSGLISFSGDPRKRNKILLRALVSLAILAILFWLLPLENLISALHSVSADIWLLVIGGFLLGHIVSAFKWRLLLRAVKVDITAHEAVRAHGAGLFANLCLPSVVGGDFVRAGVVIRDRGNIEHIALASLADRINDSFALVLIAGIAGLFIPDLSTLPAGQILAGAALLLLTGVLAGIALIRLIPVSRLPAKLEKFAARVKTALDALLDAPRQAMTAFILSVLIQSGFILLNILLAKAMQIPAPASLWFLAWPLAKLIALAPVSLGGLGVRELAIAGIMTPFGIDAARIVAQSLSWQAVLICSGLLAGFTATLMPGYTDRNEFQETKT